MPNSTLTNQECINEINRLLVLITGEAQKTPRRGRDLAIIKYVRDIQVEPLFQLQKLIELL